MKAIGFFDSMSDASDSLAAAWYSPSAAMTFARLSLSASACLAMARCISCGRSTYFTSTSVTLYPRVGLLVEDFLELHVERLPFGEELVELYLAEMLLSVVCASCEVA